MAFRSTLRAAHCKKVRVFKLSKFPVEIELVIKEKYGKGLGKSQPYQSVPPCGARSTRGHALVKVSSEMKRSPVIDASISERGVTLVEVILVVAIVAIMSGMAITSLTPRDAELKSAAYELSTNLMQARLRAIKQNEKVRVDFDTGNESYNATMVDTNTLVYHVQLNPNIDLSTGNAAITFTPLGTATNSNMQLIGATGQSYSIQVTNIGNIKVSQ